MPLTSWPTGSGVSPFKSNEAIHPWNPDLETTWRGRLMYIWGGTPPTEKEKL